MNGWLYILECCDGSYYTGSTTDLIKRLIGHKKGNAANYTKKRLPIKLVYIEWYRSIVEAYERENEIKGWSRVKKEALINYDWAVLPQLSQNYTDFPE